MFLGHEEVLEVHLKWIEVRSKGRTKEEMFNWRAAFGGKFQVVRGLGVKVL